MIEVEFYLCSAENNRVDKRPYLSKPATYRCNLIEDTSVLSPEILIDSSVPENYAYIPEFRRYYYIVDKVYETNRLVRLYLKVDPLMSYSNGIRHLTAFVDRNEYTFSKNVIDDRIVVGQGQDVTVEDCGGGEWFNIDDEYTYTITGFGLSVKEKTEAG